MDKNVLNEIEKEAKESRRILGLEQYKLPDGTVDYDALRKKLIDRIPEIVDKVCTDNTAHEKEVLKKYLRDNIFRIEDVIFDSIGDAWLKETLEIVKILNREYYSKYPR